MEKIDKRNKRLKILFSFILYILFLYFSTNILGEKYNFILSILASPLFILLPFLIGYPLFSKFFTEKIRYFLVGWAFGIIIIIIISRYVMLLVKIEYFYISEFIYVVYMVKVQELFIKNNSLVINKFF